MTAIVTARPKGRTLSQLVLHCTWFSPPTWTLAAMQHRGTRRTAPDWEPRIQDRASAKNGL